MSLPRGRFRPLLPVLALVVAFLAVAVPVNAVPADNPYVGSWVNDDLPIGTELRLQIGNTGRFHTWDEEVLGGICMGGLVTAQGRGEFVGTSFVVSPPFKRLCHPADGTGAFRLPDLPAGLTIRYDHDVATDTLELTIKVGDNVLEEGSCYYRRGTDACPTSLVPPIRAAFMYPWFPNAWNQGGQLPFSQFTPSSGLYDSSDPATIDRQVEQATDAGLEAFIASWWGPGHHTDAALTAVFDQVPQSPNPDFRIAVYYEEEGQSHPSPSAIKDDLDYLERFFDSPNYLRIDNKPVVFVWADVNDRADMATRWSDAKNLFGDVYVVLKVFPGFRDVADQPDSWHQYAPADNYSEHLPFSATVSPGFWHANEETPRLERDPVRFRNDVEAMTTSDAFWQLVTTWNEWGEGTGVEPTVEFETTYLEILSDVLVPPP